jgi:hypothetical protein
VMLSRRLKFVAEHVLFFMALYFGYVHGVDGARKAACAVVWVTLLVAVIAFVPCITDQVRARGPSVPRWSMCLSMCAPALFLYWFGDFILGSACLLSLMLASHIHYGPEGLKA